MVGLFCIFVSNRAGMTLSGRLEWRGKQAGILVNTITYIDTTDYVSEGVNPSNITGILKVEHITRGVVYENTNWLQPDFVGNGSAVVSALLDANDTFENGEYTFTVRVRDGIQGYEWSNALVVELDYTKPTISISHNVDGYASTLQSVDNTVYTGFVVGATYCHSISLPQGGSTPCGDATLNLGATIYAGEYTTTINAPITRTEAYITIYDEVEGSKSTRAYKLVKNDLWSAISNLNDAYSDNLGVNPTLAQKQKEIVLRCNVYQDEYENALQDGSTIRAYQSLSRIYTALSPDYVPSQTVVEIPVFSITPTTLHSHSNLAILSNFTEVGGELLYNGSTIAGGSDGKVKITSLDTLGYVSEKVDGTSVQVSLSNKLEVVPSWIGGKIDATMTYNSGTGVIGVSEDYLSGKVQGDYILFDSATKNLYISEDALTLLINGLIAESGGGGGGESLWTDIPSTPTNQIGTEKRVVIGSLASTTHALYVNGSVRIGTLSGIVKASGGVLTGGTLIASEIPDLDWAKITTGKPTTISGYGIADNNKFTNIPDTRDVATTPNTYNRQFATSFKTTSTLGLSGVSTYAQVIGYRAWEESSGGYAHELAFVNEGIYHRAGSSTTWEVGWDKLMTNSEVYTRTYIDANFYTKSYITSNFYTKGNINNFFSGATAITGYNKTNWDSVYTSFNDFFEKKSDGHGGYYIRAKYTLASDYNLVAFTDSGQALPSIFDSLPIASSSQLGVVKVGTSLTISGGVLNVSGDVFNLSNYYSKTDINNFFSGATSITGYNRANWDTAYSVRQQWNGGATNLVAATGRNSLDVAQKQSSITDTTTGRGLIVGAFGLGSQGINITLADNSYSRLFWTQTDTPSAGNYMGIKMLGITGYSFDLAARNDRFWVRTSEGGTQQSWRQIYHTGNLVNPTTGIGTENRLAIWSGQNNLSSNSSLSWSTGLDVSSYVLSTYNRTVRTTNKTHSIINSTASSEDAWNNSINYSLKLTNSNNAMGFIVGGVSNNRVGMIQVGHDSLDYAYSLGVLSLSPLGGGVAIGKTSVGSGYVLDTNGSVKVGGVLVATGGAGIGKTTVESGYILDTNGSVKVNGNIVATGNITAFQASDKRLKREIKPIVNGLELLGRLNPVTYKWNNKAKSLFNADVNKNNFGLIAQELAEVLPELTGGMFGGKNLGVDYTPIINILIAAVKELNKKIEEIN